MTPKQRGPGQTGGSNHRSSKFKSVARGGRPSAGRAKKSGCALTALGVLLGVAAFVGCVTNLLS